LCPSTQALIEFSEFFLTTCIDQVDHMSSLLEPDDLIRRMRLHIEDEIGAGSLPKGSFPLLREALLACEVQRGRAAEITGYGERMARMVVSDLLKNGYLKSKSTVVHSFSPFLLILLNDGSLSSIQCAKVISLHSQTAIPLVPEGMLALNKK
jgi:hypothetical protein